MNKREKKFVLLAVPNEMKDKIPLICNKLLALTAEVESFIDEIKDPNAGLIVLLSVVINFLGLLISHAKDNEAFKLLMEDTLKKNGFFVSTV